MMLLQEMSRVKEELAVMRRHTERGTSSPGRLRRARNRTASDSVTRPASLPGPMVPENVYRKLEAEYVAALERIDVSVNYYCLR